MGMQIGAKNIENLLVTMVLSRFSFLLAWELTKQISIWNYPNNRLWELSKGQLIEHKISYKTNFNESLLLAKGNNTNNTKILSHM